MGQELVYCLIVHWCIWWEKNTCWKKVSTFLTKTLIASFVEENSPMCICHVAQLDDIAIMCSSPSVLTTFFSNLANFQCAPKRDCVRNQRYFTKWNVKKTFTTKHMEFEITKWLCLTSHRDSTKYWTSIGPGLLLLILPLVSFLFIKSQRPGCNPIALLFVYLGLVNISFSSLANMPWYRNPNPDQSKAMKRHKDSWYMCLEK